MTSKKLNHIKDNYFYRAADSRDEINIKRIVHDSLIEYGLVPDPEGIDSDLNDVVKVYAGGYFGVLCTEDDEVMGCFGLYPLNSETCEIRKMYFKPIWRGKGLGKWVVYFLIAKARYLGFQTIALETASPLVQAIALYTKLGFEEMFHENQTPRCDKSFEMRL